MCFVNLIGITSLTTKCFYWRKINFFHHLWNMLKFVDTILWSIWLLIHFKNSYKLSTILIDIRTEWCIILWTDFSGLCWFSFGISIWSHYEFCIQIITLRAQLCSINKFLSVSQSLNKYSLWMKNLMKLQFIWQIKLWPAHDHG